MKGALVETMEEEKPKENFIVIEGGMFRLRFKKAKCPDIKEALQKQEKKFDPEEPVGKYASEWIINRLKFDKTNMADQYPTYEIGDEHGFKLILAEMVQALYKAVGFKEDKSQKKLEGD